MARPRFLCDEHLQRLARWLRAAGYDAALQPGVDDGVLLARARREGRLLLTLDRALAERRDSGCVRRLPSHDPREQLRHLVAEFGLDLDARAFTRCLRCNVEVEEADPATVDVPERVRDRCTRFRRCPRCGRVYWEGTHVERLRGLFRQAVAEAARP